jgi:hypothetical protein
MELQDRQRQLDDFQANRHPPEAPKQFDSVDSLIEFNLQKGDHEEDLREYSNRLAEARKNFVPLASRLGQLLPEGIPLIYEYQTFGVGPVGKQFKIVRRSSGETSEVQIEELDN